MRIVEVRLLIGPHDDEELFEIEPDSTVFMLRKYICNMVSTSTSKKYAGIACNPLDFELSRGEVSVKLRDKLADYPVEGWICRHASWNPPIQEDNSAPRFLIPLYSSSQIQNHADVYDVFSCPCGPKSFVPNKRLRLLKDISLCESDERKANDMEVHFRDVLYPDGWIDAPGGSETNITGTVAQLVVDNVQCAMKTRSAQFSVVVRNKRPFFTMVMSQTTNSEYHLSYFHNGTEEVIPLLSVAQSLSSSARDCLLQFLQIGGDAAIQLYRLGLAREHCAAIGTVCFGEYIQIYGVYLIAEQFPVIVALSDPICCCNGYQYRRQLCKWILKMADFSLETLRLVSTSQATRIISNAKLLVTGHFFKPVRKSISGTFASSSLKASNRRIRLEDIMQLYARLCDVRHSNNYILFPEGVISLPAEDVSESKMIYDKLISTLRADGFFHVEKNTPLIVFPRLSAEYGWKCHKPTDATMRFKEEFYAAMDVLDNAKIAHLDLQPHNILWRSDREGRVEIKLIDFEDSQEFGVVICPRWIRLVVEHGNGRYPFTTQDTERSVVASKEHNDWFRDVISGWLDDGEDCFATFMSNRVANIQVSISDDYMCYYKRRRVA